MSETGCILLLSNASAKTAEPAANKAYNSVLLFQLLEDTCYTILNKPKPKPKAEPPPKDEEKKEETKPGENEKGEEKMDQDGEGGEKQSDQGKQGEEEGKTTDPDMEID